MNIKTLASLILSFLAGCGAKPPVIFEDANIYQRAVYYNKIRPYVDRKRDKERKPDEILAFSNIKPGSIVVDLLGGSGWYTEILSNVVGPKGHVYIVNPPLFVNFAGDDLTKRLEKNRLKNVTRLDVPWNDLQLPRNVDFIWLALSFHDIYVHRPNRPEFEANRVHFFEQMRHTLKPGGFLLITDHVSKPSQDVNTAVKLHRIDESFTKNELAREGFTFIRESAALRYPQDNYTLDIWNKEVRRKTDKFVHLYQLSDQ
ncbi:class I SAM-dependent methyltransferase [Teredinibacter haidensis]|uniref:class I SAM-dependent methyltransferase n=1 Tax=Teredinibacter haidensis TaxID=2731755 RepID=UPI0009488B0F|nr:class I SAM-dependent methyltransferase [Teredinibacter haidensis]